MFSKHLLQFRLYKLAASQQRSGHMYLLCSTDLNISCIGQRGPVHFQKRLSDSCSQLGRESIHCQTIEDGLTYATTLHVRLHIWSLVVMGCENTCSAAELHPGSFVNTIAKQSYPRLRSSNLPVRRRWNDFLHVSKIIHTMAHDWN